MKKTVLLALIIACAFASGFAFKSLITPETDDTTPVPRKVTGIGGIFFKCKDPKKLKEWYKTHLGLNTNQYGAVFEWFQGADSTKKGFTQWSPFKETTTYFQPSEKDFMVNYRVLDIEGLVAELKQNGVTVLDTIEHYDYGSFVHILDLEGNKIELWQPNDEVYEAMGREMGSPTTK